MNTTIYKINYMYCILVKLSNSNQVGIQLFLRNKTIKNNNNNKNTNTNINNNNNKILN